MQRTEAKKQACSLKTGSQQALFLHGELKHLRIPPHIHFRACRSFMASSCGTVWKNWSSSLRARAIGACSNSSSGWRARVYTSTVSDDSTSWEARCHDELVDALLKQGQKHLEAGPDTQPWCKSAARGMPVAAPQCACGVRSFSEHDTQPWCSPWCATRRVPLSPPQRARGCAFETEASRTPSRLAELRNPKSAPRAVRECNPEAEAESPPRVPPWLQGSSVCSANSFLKRWHWHIDKSAPRRCPARPAAWDRRHSVPHSTQCSTHPPALRQPRFSCALCCRAQQFPRPCALTVAYGASGFEDVSCSCATDSLRSLHFAGATLPNGIHYRINFWKSQKLSL